MLRGVYLGVSNGYWTRGSSSVMNRIAIVRLWLFSHIALILPLNYCVFAYLN